VDDGLGSSCLILIASSHLGAKKRSHCMPSDRGSSKLNYLDATENVIVTGGGARCQQRSSLNNVPFIGVFASENKRK
jgi:hypothetical protein